MTAFGGLFRKEWMLMRYTLMAFVVMYMLIGVFSYAPIVVGGIVTELDGVMQMFSNMHIFLGATLFLHSVHTDMKQPDIWLHSPASIWRLLGVKMVMAVLLVIVSFFISGAMAGIAYFIGGFENGIPALFGSALDMQSFFKMLLITIFTISLSLPLWVIYRILELKLGLLAVFVVLILFSVVSMGWGIMEAIWAVFGSSIGIVLYIFSSFVFFAGGASLLEKKVRY